MSNIEKIRTEYMLYESDFIPTTKENAIEYLATTEYFLYKTIKDIDRAKREDKIDQYVNKVISFLGLSTEEYDNALAMDIKVLEQEQASISVYELLNKKLLETITDDNYLEICRLGNFLSMKLFSLDNYYDDVFKSIELYYGGIHYQVNGEDETTIFREFFLEEHTKILKSNGREKKLNT